MKKVLFAASALAALSLGSAAQAADVAPAGYDWSGFYIGANAGVAWNNSSVDNRIYTIGENINELENRIDGNQAAFTAGGLIGYNYQVDRVVMGVETDFNYLGFSDSNDGGLVSDDAVYTTHGSFEADWFGTIRARLGYAFDNLLIYGTGGAAYGHMSADGKVVQEFSTGTATWKGSTDTTNWGWTVGGGAEYGIDKWSVGVEYLYVDLGNAEWNSALDDQGSQLKGDVDFAFSTVRATVKYRFQ